MVAGFLYLDSEPGKLSAELEIKPKLILPLPKKYKGRVFRVESSFSEEGYKYSEKNLIDGKVQEHSLDQLEEGFYYDFLYLLYALRASEVPEKVEVFMGRKRREISIGKIYNGYELTTEKGSLFLEGDSIFRKISSKVPILGKLELILS